MTEAQKLHYLSIALRIIGAIFVVGLYPLMMWIWPSGWAWEPRQPEYEHMIQGVYATLGVFLILAAKNPMENLGLIRFTLWSSVVHAGIMLIHAIADVDERPHLFGDIPALLLIAIVLWLLLPQRQDA
jgi:hypothetical protein